MILVLKLLLRFVKRSSRISKIAITALFLFTSNVLTIASLPIAAAIAATPSVTAPSTTIFSKNVAGQEPGNFVIANFGPEDTLLVSVGLVDPPTGTSFALPITTGLTAGFGYNFTGNKTQISFTGKQADANSALAAMTVATGSSGGDVEIRVSASLSTTNVYFNPINGHYYEFVSTKATTDCLAGTSGATCITNIEDAIASKTLYGAQGYWATITSAQENSFVGNNMNAPDIAIGLSDRETEGTWRWLYGPEKGIATYFAWSDREPNNHSSGEDYVVTNWGTRGRWNDYGRPAYGDLLSYIVEYSTNCFSVTSGNCVSGTFVETSQASATVTSTVNGWGEATPAEFADDIPLSTPQEMYTSSVSCSSPGNCTAVGQFRNSTSGLEAFTMTSTGGVWALARPAEFGTGIQRNSPDAFLFWVSCSSPGNCTAVGQFRDINEALQAFTMTSTGGVWTLAQPAVFPTLIQSTPLNSVFNSVSCTSPGNCTAVGQFLNSTGGNEAFTMTSTGGVWGTARPAVFPADIQNTSLDSVFNSVSCASPGNCTAVGQFKNITGGFEAFTMTSTNGVWALARPAVFVDFVQDVSKYGLFTSVSCASPGSCTAVGLVRNSDFTNKAFTMTSTNGEWGTARPAVFPAPTQSSSLSSNFNSVSCASPDNCTAVGRFQNAVDDFQAFTMTSTGGDWDYAQPAQFNAGLQNIEPDDVLRSVSCATPGNCTAVGDFMNSINNKEAFTYTSINGVWGAAEPAEFSDGVRSNSGSASFYSVSCSTPGNCTALGDFSSIASGRKAFTATSVDNTLSSQSTSESPPTTTVAPSITTVSSTTTTVAPSITTVVSPTQLQPKIVVQQNKLKTVPVTPTENTSTTTTTTISQDAPVTTLAPELQTSSESGSIGWWLLGGSSTIGLWWFILARRRRREDAPITESSKD
jgi:hypothetical protein